jgi:hypothetical protein
MQDTAWTLSRNAEADKFPDTWTSDKTGLMSKEYENESDGNLIA